MYRLLPHEWKLESETFATIAVYRRNWLGMRGWSQQFPRSGSGPPQWRTFEQQPLTLEPPDYFATEMADTEMMTAPQLRRSIAELSQSGFNYLPQAVELQRKIAFPFVTFVMTLLAVPFGVTTGRRGALYGIGLGIVIALSYWLVMSVFIAIGKTGLLPASLAAWTPNIIVSACAIYLILTTKT